MDWARHTAAVIRRVAFLAAAALATATWAAVVRASKPVAGVEYADGGRAAFGMSGLDSGGEPSIYPMQDDLIAHSLALVFPTR